MLFQRRVIVEMVWKIVIGPQRFFLQIGKPTEQF